MTNIAFLIFIAVAAVASVQAEDLKDSRRDVLGFCNQFVINNPDPEMHFSYDDCNFYDRDDASPTLHRR
jgi:hypothetical protein